MNPMRKKAGLQATLLATAVMAVQLLPLPASALTFNIVYGDVSGNTGEGFDDDALGADRRAVVTDVTDYLSSVIDSPGTIDLQVQNSWDIDNGPLGNGGTYFFDGPPGYSSGLAQQHAETGQKPFNGIADAFLRLNFAYDYNLSDADPASNQFDLFSVVLHEIAHGLGFITLLDQNGNSRVSPSNPGTFTVFDSYLIRGDGTRLFDDGGTFLGTSADLTSDDIFYNGPAAVAQNGGDPLKVFAPTTYQPGSSLSHLDASVFSDAVTQPSLLIGTSRRAFTDVELALLVDIGYDLTTSAIPAPSSLVLFAFGAFGLRIRKKAKA